MQGNPVEYHGDPLQDFTLMRFLDRFVCKNPKQKVNDHGGSLMQRTSKLVKSQQREVSSIALLENAMNSNQVLHY
jgi:ribosome biogenesis protein MAK21